MISRRMTLALASVAMATLPFLNASAAVDQDTLIKGSTSTLYYYASNGFRYVFPNEGTFFSWFSDFSRVKTISDAELAAIPLRGNVTYRPGIRLIKVQTDPKTYAVDAGGKLRWVQSEAAAQALYGASWNKNIDDLPDAFFVNYQEGAPISGLEQFNPDQVAAQTQTINRDLGLTGGSTAPQSDTQVGQRAVRLAGDVLPDLVPFAPYELHYDTVNGRKVIRFTATFWNSGDGALELTATAPSNGGDQDVDTFQKIYQKDGSSRQMEVGHFMWHGVHDHYHYANFADYSLFPATSSEMKNIDPTVTQKTTFCMRDDLAVNTGLPGASARANYSVCGINRQGVSVGWADRYPSTLPDQYIDVHDVEPGTYRLSFIVDPQQRFIEKSVGNNSSATIIEINPATESLRVIATGAAYQTSANRFPDNMLIRSDDDFTVYVIKNNTKRVLTTTDIVNSYGYVAGNAIVLPAGIVRAIPDTRLVRLSGTSAIYVINEAGFRRRVLNPEIMASYGFDETSVADINATEFASYTETELIVLAGTDRVFSTTTKQYVGSLSSLTTLGYNPASVHVVNEADFYAVAVHVVLDNLEVPWDIVFLPDGDMLVTERPGTLRRVGAQNAMIQIPFVRSVDEGGLMGIALHPEFASNNLLYLYYTTDVGGKSNRIVRFRLDGTQLIQDRIIIEGIPSDLYHDGGQIAFGPDGMLYVTTGDASEPDLAQDLGSLAGKTLRLTPDGGIPSDNPFGNAVWSYGHRNSQGIAWDNQGRMWQTEHGRSGAQSGYDELNLVEKGKNYGWPTIQGGEQRAGMVTPRLHSTADYTWAPAGIAFIEGQLFFAGLRGSELYAVSVSDQGTLGTLRQYYSKSYGRLRAVTAGPDGYLYFTTSNRDGRGDPADDDDKILRIHPDFLAL